MGRASDGPRPDPPLLLVGTDFRSSPLELRERVAYNGEDAEDLLVRLMAQPEVAEAYLLSTCNRTEIYLQPRDEEQAYRTALELVFARRAAEMEKPGRLYVKRNAEAARHLLAVACGLESMVLGEPEILGQVKQAATLAETIGASGTVLRRLLRTAIGASKRARSETGITTGAVSMGYAVVELAKNIFTDFEASRVLMVGAGEIARVVTRNLIERGIVHLTVANRTASRGEEFVGEFPGTRTLPWDERVEGASAADIVVVTTGAPEPVLNRAHVGEAMAERPSRPLLVVDLGVPRNVEPSAGKIENVFLHTVDSLDHLIQRNLKRRREEVPRVDEIIGRELDLYRAWLRGLDAEPLVARLQKQAERIRRQEVEAALASFPPETHAQLERLTRSLVRKILHHPSTQLRGRGDAEGRWTHLEAVRELFHLDDEDEEKKK